MEKFPSLDNLILFIYVKLVQLASCSKVSHVKHQITLLHRQKNLFLGLLYEEANISHPYLVLMKASSRGVLETLQHFCPEERNSTYYFKKFTNSVPHYL